MTPNTPEFYCATGYATLLMVLAMTLREVRHSDVETGRRTDVGVWLWRAETRFETARLLAAGKNLFAVVAPKPKLKTRTP
jgi:hypothetical protein